MAEFGRSNRTGSKQPVRLAQKYAFSDKFKNMFAEGMALVEESAAFLDGPGREAVKDLDRATSLIYGTQSMRLTTRLMQLASWLLLQRAANEGEMSTDQILEEKAKIKLENLPPAADDLAQYPLPQKFHELVDQSIHLQNRIIRLDNELYGDKTHEENSDINPVNDQIELLSTAFGTKKYQ